MCLVCLPFLSLVYKPVCVARWQALAELGDLLCLVLCRAPGGHVSCSFSNPSVFVIWFDGFLQISIEAFILMFMCLLESLLRYNTLWLVSWFHSSHAAIQLEFFSWGLQSGYSYTALYKDDGTNENAALIREILSTQLGLQSRPPDIHLLTLKVNLSVSSVVTAMLRETSTQSKQTNKFIWFVYRYLPIKHWTTLPTIPSVCIRVISLITESKIEMENELCIDLVNQLKPPPKNLS